MPRPAIDSEAARPDTAVPSSSPTSATAEPIDPLYEAETLRALLQQAQLRLGRLLAALKHDRRHSRALQAAMASLRQLRLGP